MSFQPVKVYKAILLYLILSLKKVVESYHTFESIIYTRYHGESNRKQVFTRQAIAL